MRECSLSGCLRAVDLLGLTDRTVDTSLNTRKNAPHRKLAESLVTKLHTLVQIHPTNVNRCL